MRYFLYGNAVYKHFLPLLDTQAATSRDDAVVCVREGEDADAGVFAGFKVIRTDSVPYQTQVIVLPVDRELSAMRPGASDSIFLMEDWTFLNSENMEMAKKYRREYPYSELRIVLFASARKTLSTDITDGQPALDPVVAAYEQEGFAVTVIDRRGMGELFYWKSRDYFAMLKRDYRNRLVAARHSFDHAYDLHYAILMEMLVMDLLHPGSFAQYTKNDTLVKQTADLFFCRDSLFRIELSDMIHAFTKNICLWDEDKLMDDIQFTLQKQFSEELLSALPAIDLGNFAQYCRNFFSETARVTVKAYLDRLFIRMEELL